MTRWSTWLPALGGVSARQVRAEAFFLGNRYRGETVEGAQKELQLPGVSDASAALLRAVIRATLRATSQRVQA